MENREIAEMFDEIAQMLSLDSGPTILFQVRAYQKAALTIGTLQENVSEIYEKRGLEGLMELPGIGKGLAEKIGEYVKTGKMKMYTELKKKYPINFKELTSIEGLGAKRAVILYKELGVTNLKELADAVKKHKVKALAGFGEKSEEMILKGMELKEGSKGRMLLGDALPVAESIIKKIKESGLADMVMIAGSARRMRETVGDLDILVLSEKSPEVMKFFKSLPEIASVVVSGPTKTTVMLKLGITCDLRSIPTESFGAAIQYFTGSKDHNVQVRTIAVRMGYSLNEYGLSKDGKIIPMKNEEEIYNKLGMQWMPAEMREARGEVKLAQAHKIPKIVELKDIKGDMHSHTLETDGANTIDEMAAEAMKIGLEYLATTNHTKSLFIARGMDEKKFAAFYKKVDALNEKHEGKFRVIKGAEVDILKDGTLDLDSKFLKSMECVVASVHQNLKLDKEAMTKRVVKALDSGLVHVLGHPTGRELLKREPFAIDLEKVFEAAERNKVALEINSYPERLDLNDTNAMCASKYKVNFSLGTDAHRTAHLHFMRYGVGVARRAWLTPDRIINTLSTEKILKLLAK